MRSIVRVTQKLEFSGTEENIHFLNYGVCSLNLSFKKCLWNSNYSNWCEEEGQGGRCWLVLHSLPSLTS